MSYYDDGPDLFTVIGRQYARWRRARAHRKATQQQRQAELAPWQRTAIQALDAYRCPDCQVVRTYTSDGRILRATTERIPCQQHADPVSVQLEQQVTG